MIVLVIIKQNKCNDIHIQHIGIHDYFNAIIIYKYIDPRPRTFLQNSLTENNFNLEWLK